jgi:hypothetical protein
MRRIEVGQRVADSYVVLSGISSQDQVLYEGIQQVKDGDIVMPKKLEKPYLSLYQ